LIDDDHDGATTESLRMIEIQVGGNSPQHSHPYEHENFVVEGKGRLLIGDTWYDLSQGDVAFVPADVLHQYVNAGNTPFKFLCGIPVKNLQGSNTQNFGAKNACTCNTNTDKSTPPPIASC
jgi:quercetin dioxygenase-like cupin family protein